MWVLSNFGEILADTDKITRFNTSKDGLSISMMTIDGRAVPIAWYSSLEKCKQALELAYQAFIHGNVAFAFPDEDDLPNQYVAKEHWHHATGKKTKGHGGS